MEMEHANAIEMGIGGHCVRHVLGSTAYTVAAFVVAMGLVRQLILEVEQTRSIHTSNANVHQRARNHSQRGLEKHVVV